MQCTENNADITITFHASAVPVTADVIVTDTHHTHPYTYTQTRTWTQTHVGSVSQCTSGEARATPSSYGQ